MTGESMEEEEEAAAQENHRLVLLSEHEINPSQITAQADCRGEWYPLYLQLFPRVVCQRKTTVGSSLPSVIVMLQSYINAQVHKENLNDFQN